MLAQSHTLEPFPMAYAVAAAALFLLAGGENVRAQGRPTRVEVVRVEKRAVAPTLDLVGTVQPLRRSAVAGEVSGCVVEMLVDAGDRVTRGQVICRLRADVRRAAHAEAVAVLARLAAVLAERKAELRKAEFEKKRIVELWEQDQGSEKEYIDTLADFDIAAGRVEQARQDVEAQKAVAARLKDDLARTEIRAPFAGHVVKKETDIGAWIMQGGPVIQLIDLSTVRVRVRAPESIIAFCPVGADATVGIDALGRRFAATIARVVPDADEQAHTFPVELDVANPDGALKAGMFARVSVPAGPKVVRLVIPKDAVVLRGSAQILFVVRSGEAEGMAMALPMPVRIVSELFDYVAIEAEGLAEGDQVIVRGNENMFGPGPVIPMPHRSETQAQTAEAAPQSDSKKKTAEADPATHPKTAESSRG